MAKKADPNQTNLFVSDTRAHRYTIVVYPGFQISEKVKQLKQQLNAIAPISAKDLRSRPHITICFKDHHYNADELIIRKVGEAIAGTGNFDIKVDGFDYWENGVFFMKLKDQGPIFRLMLMLQEALNVSQGKSPHLTIARGVKRKDLEKLAPEDLDYESTFNCNSLTILKETLDADEPKTETLHKFIFKG